MTRVLLDTGPLVAFLNRRDTYQEWAKERFAEISPPLITCEAVLAEVCHLLRKHRGGSDAVMDLIARGVLACPFRIDAETRTLRRLLKKYEDVPMALADACLVRMSEQYSDCCILTLDRHFRLYRRHGRQVIPAIMPPDR